MSDVRKRVCGRVRELRHRCRLTQEKFAFMAGLSPDAIAQIERQGATPSLETIDKICAALGISLHDFFKGIDVAPSGRAKDRAIGDLITYLKGKSVEEIRRIHRIATLTLEG